MEMQRETDFFWFRFLLIIREAESGLQRAWAICLSYILYFL